MEKIPTAEEYIGKPANNILNVGLGGTAAIAVAINYAKEYTKLHVKAALEAVNKLQEGSIYSQDLKNVYDLNNIK